MSAIIPENPASYGTIEEDGAWLATKARPGRLLATWSMS
jgi:hypothetical protein